MANQEEERPSARRSGGPPRLSLAFFYGTLLLLLYLTYLVVVPFASPILWAAVLVVIFYPAYQRLLRLFKGRSGLAAFLFTTAVILAVIIPAFFFGWVLAREAAALYQVAERFYQQRGLEGITTHPVVAAGRALWERVSIPFKRMGVDLNGLLLAALNAVSNFILDNLKGIAKNLLSFSVNFLLTTFTLFFLLRDGEAIVGGLKALLPLKREHTDALFARLNDAVSAVVHGTLLTALAQGAMGAVGYWIFGVPFPVFLGLATALVSLLPVGGSALVWIPAAVYLFIKGSWIRGVLLLAWSGLIVSTADNILKPSLMSSGTNLPTLFLFFGMLGGLEVFGVLGFILGPVLLVMLAAFLDMYQEFSSRPTNGTGEA
jgi:predicted PurR-regulated permease PerM